jgi:prophage maintenance system killer protein
MNLTDENKRLPLWKDIIAFLEKNGYKIAQSSTSKGQIALMLVESDISADELQSLLQKNGFHSKISRIIDH